MNSLNIFGKLSIVLAANVVNAQVGTAPQQQLLNTAAVDPTGLVEHLKELQREAQDAREKAAAECRAKTEQNNQTIEGRPLVTFDPVEIQKCIAEKKEKLSKIATSIKQLISKEMSKSSSSSSSSKPCVTKLDQKSKACYTKTALQQWIKDPRFSVDVHNNEAEIWEGDTLLMMIVHESPKYVIMKPPKICRTFFKKPNYKMDINRAGDMITSEGKPNQKKPQELNCKPCSDFLNTTEGKFANCDNSCSPINILTSVKDTITEENSKVIDKKLTKNVEKENKEE